MTCTYELELVLVEQLEIKQKQSFYVTCINTFILLHVNAHCKICEDVYCRFKNMFLH